MNKEGLLKCLAEGLNHILCLKLNKKNAKVIEAAVNMFIIEDASRYTAHEIIHNFSTMEKGLKRFLSYMEAQRAFRRVTIH